MSMTSDDYILKIRKKMEEIPRHLVYFGLKDYGVKRLQDPTVDLTLECLAMHFCGLPILVGLIEAVHRPTKNIYNLLHRLGDYNVLTLVRHEKHSLRFVINPHFLKILRLPEGIDESRGED